MRALQRKPRKYEVLSEESKGFFGKALGGRASGTAKTTKRQVLPRRFVLFTLDILPASSDHLLSSLPNSGSRPLWILKAVPTFLVATAWRHSWGCYVWSPGSTALTAAQRAHQPPSLRWATSPLSLQRDPRMRGYSLGSQNFIAEAL